MVSGLITLMLMLLFVAGWIGLWNPKYKRELEAAARQPMNDAENIRPEAYVKTSVKTYEQRDRTEIQR